MITLEKPKRVWQKEKDYLRHKLIRKLKKRSKRRRESQQHIAERELKKQL